jgi:23S rRNA (cytidine1920-2'-O)/16S rRNA (cytidine1409-2'-O)-methyltransferase
MNPKKATKRSLIQRLLDDGLAPDKDTAGKWILAGLVRVNGERGDKAGMPVPDDAVVEAVQSREFVGRGAYKLEAALKAFSISVAGAVCADVGACTGGFTEVLLRAHAGKVYAIDVGYGDLDWKIRSDPRVVVMERTNARHVESLGEPVSVVSIDVSFISLTKILPAVTLWLGPQADIVALVKPQFEAEQSEVGKGGVVVESAVHDRVIQEVAECARALGLRQMGLKVSPILGMEGNKEFLLWLRKP